MLMIDVLDEKSSILIIIGLFDWNPTAMTAVIKHCLLRAVMPKQ